MCGFAGIVSFTHPEMHSSNYIKAMGDMLQFRGPDEESLYESDFISFVFRRLAIIDLEKGSQPIWNEQKTVFVAVNGEIYNYLELKQEYFEDSNFQSNSDSEVVLHLYLKFGESCFEKLNGMFAISIWDSRNNELIIARDRLGIKPLYYSHTQNGLIFGSELKAILMHPSCPREINWSQLQTVGLQDCEEVPSYVNGVNHFPAGSFAKFSLESKNKLVIRRYWDIRDRLRISNKISAKSAINSYKNLIEDSLTKRLMSDVPVGLFLSGGLDSSVLAALAARNTKNIHCFTVVEKATYESGDVDKAREVCAQNGLNFHPILFSLPEMLNQFDLSQLEKMVFMMESPRFDLEWYFKSELHRSARAIVPNLKVIILGQGADEFAGGYSSYLGSPFSNWEEYVEQSVKKHNRDSLAREKQIPNRFINTVKPTHSNDHDLGAYKERMLRFSYQLQHFNLWHEDRTSSFFGIESRVPFLDHRLVEFLCELPEELHSELFWNKNILRRSADELDIAYNHEHPKVPFFVTTDNTTISDFAVGACRNIFSEFMAKYSESCELSKEKIAPLKQLYINSQKQNTKSSHYAWELLETMCVMIFEKFCLSPKNFMIHDDHSTQEHYPKINSTDWSNLEELVRGINSSEGRVVGETTIINIPDDCEILNPLTEDEGKTALALVCNGEQLCRVEIPDSHVWIVMMLDEMGRHISNPQNVEFWSNKAKIPVQHLIPVLQDLVKGGFLVISQRMETEAI